MHELPGNPFQGAGPGVVFGTKDLLVPLAQVGILLVEVMHLVYQELIEVAEHECCWRLVAMWEIAPVKVGLDSAIGVVVAEVGYKYNGVHEGQCQTFW